MANSTVAVTTLSRISPDCRQNDETRVVIVHGASRRYNKAYSSSNTPSDSTPSGNAGLIPRVAIVANLASPPILSQVAQPGSVLVHKVDARHVRNEEVRHQHPDYADNRRDNESPPTPPR